MNWFKKKFEQLSAKMNGEDEPFDNAAIDGRKIERERSGVRVDNTYHRTTVVPENRADNIEELKEITIGAITAAVRMLGYGKAIVSKLNFHSKFAANAVESIGLVDVIKDEDFIKRIKRDFKSKGIQFKNDFSVDIIYESKQLDKVTRITDVVGVEILTPAETLKKINAELKATEGITWEELYVLEPTGKQYFIGRCKDPKVEHGPKIHNDIAFVGIEEKNEPQYEINNYVSRSHAIITFDKDLGAYKIYRSKFLNNPSHKIKIYNTVDDYKEVSLTQSKVPHVLRNGDSICFNDKIVLEFTIHK